MKRILRGVPSRRLHLNSGYSVVMVINQTANLWRSVAGDRRGAAAAEFAMVLPFLMTMFFGIVKFGIALNNNLALTDGVRAGSRELAIARSSTLPWTNTKARIASATPGLTQANIALTFTVNGTPCTNDATCIAALLPAAGQPVTVTATYPCDVTIMGYDFAPTCTLSSQTTERVE